MKKTLFILLSLCLLIGCGKKSNDTEVLIETSMGDIKIKLYDDTPLHKENFIKLAKSGAYDNILWHRIVKDFMIQTGDPSIKPGGEAPTVDTESMHYTIPQEIGFPHHFHRRGVIGAARQPDSINVKKASSGTQFYIVSGKTFSPGALSEMRSELYQQKITEREAILCRQNQVRLDYLKNHDNTAYQELRDSILTAAGEYMAHHPLPAYSEAHKKIYSTQGGAPHLDAEYTIFGEVIEGMGIVDKIALIPTDSKEHPLKEVVVKKVTVLE